MPQVAVPGRIAQKLFWYYLPAYTAAEAARISGLSPRALRRRVAGFLSFADLLKALPVAELAHCVEVDQCGTPSRLYPRYPGRDSLRIIAVDPRIAFGRPIVLRTGVSTRAIYARIR